MDISRSILTAAVCLVSVGCEKASDYLPTYKEKQAIEQAMKESSRQDGEGAADSRERGELQAFRSHVESVSGMLAGEITAVDRSLVEMKADSETLAKAMSSAAAGEASGDETEGRKNALLALLRDAAVNSLARKYLRRSFTMEVRNVEDRVREAVDNYNRVKERLDANAAEASSAVESAEKEARRARTSALEAERKLKKQMEELRRRIRRLEHEINMVASTDRSRKSRELKVTRDELRRMEHEYDGMRSSKETNFEVRRSDVNVRDARREADERRYRADRETRRSVVGKLPADVLAEFEHSTVVALESAISEALAAAESRRVQLVRAAAYVKSAGAGRESLAPSALRRIRADIDSQVNAALGSGKK